MADEAQINSSLSIKKGNVDYRSHPNSFKVSVVAANPTAGKPGGLTVPVAGVDIDLSGLVEPGLCRVENVDSTNYVEIGLKYLGDFFHFMEIGPGESYVFKISRNYGEVDLSTGTGTTGSNATIHAIANGGPVEIKFEAFEK